MSFSNFNATYPIGVYIYVCVCKVAWKLENKDEVSSQIKQDWNMHDKVVGLCCFWFVGTKFEKNRTVFKLFFFWLRDTSFLILMNVAD